MRGLRVYINPNGRDRLCAGSIFYSRRGGGPYYRWRYEELRGHWQSSRLDVDDLAVTELVSTPWNGIPTALKTSLDEHYVD